ncbi:MAG: GTP cyclohydrolase 1 [Chlamydiae bacterium]|nr:GTP cyclohydrolase 1 [Chlamydiota bacterium]
MQLFNTALRSIFKQIGEDPHRKGLRRTPERMIQMYQSFLTGYQKSVDDLLGHPIELDQHKSQDIIVMRNIPFCSLCEHHLVPFHGEVHVAYLPNLHTLGLGRVFEYVESVSRKLTLQENLSSEIGLALFEKLDAKALIVKIVGWHTCLTLTRKSLRGSSLVTHSFFGTPDLKPQLVSQVHDFT